LYLFKKKIKYLQKILFYENKTNHKKN